MGFVVMDCVNQASVSTGDGDFVLGAALTGYLTFADAVAPLATFCYEIHAVNEAGGRSGQWEIGIGQFFVDGATPKLRRLVKLSGSDQVPDVLIDFSAGTKHVSISVSAAQAKAVKFPGPLTFYVRADGNDANSGLADTAGQAFLTIFAAVEHAASVCRKATVSVGAGAFDSTDLGDVAKGCEINIVGAGIGTTTFDGLSVAAGDVWLYDFSLPRASAQNGAVLRLGNVSFSECLGDPQIDVYGATVFVQDDIHLAGDSTAWLSVTNGGLARVTGSVTLASNVAFDVATVVCGAGSICDLQAASFVPGAFAVTAPRYDVSGNGVINTGGLGESFILGDAGGVKTTGGQYL